MLIWGNPYTFQPNSQQHAVVLATLFATTAAAVYVGRRLPVATRRWLEPWAGVALLAIWFVANLYDATRSTSTLRDSLPLHWCDLAGLLAATVMVWPSRTPRAVLHAVGLCLSPLAFILPTERNGPMIASFWVYFVPHAAIVVAAAYDGAVRGFRPDFPDLRRAFALIVLWVAILMPINVWLDANYGYVGERDVGQRSVVVAFGPWPRRILPLLALTAAAMISLVVVERALYGIGRALRELRNARFDRLRLFSRPAARPPRPRLIRPATPLVPRRAA